MASINQFETWTGGSFTNEKWRSEVWIKEMEIVSLMEKGEGPSRHSHTGFKLFPMGGKIERGGRGTR